MRTAIFTDAGYLYGAGSTAIAGERQRREVVELKLPETISKLKETAAARTGESAHLLRIYWYDGALHSGLSAEQQQLAETDNVKVRLGIINFAGQQKGVDSLIVTDLIELARNHAISDAVLLAGDEDLRIGVQIAQSFGVRVHLIGIEPSRGNQSRALMQEADTTVEWSKSDISEILTLTSGAGVSYGIGERPMSSRISNEIAGELEQAIDKTVASLDRQQLSAVAGLGTGERIPGELDRDLLRNCGEKLDRWLEPHESEYARGEFKEKARSAIAGE